MICPKVKFISASYSPENSWLWCRIPLISLASLELCDFAKAAAHTPPTPEWFSLYTKIDTHRRSLLSWGHHQKLDILRTFSSEGKEELIDDYMAEGPSLGWAPKIQNGDTKAPEERKV